MALSPDLESGGTQALGREQLKRGSISSALVALAGCALVMTGCFAPWIAAVQGTIRGIANQTVSPSLYLSDLGAQSWTYAFAVLAACALGTAWLCQLYRAARWLLVLIGVVIVVLAISIYHGHGYPASSASMGPILVIVGGLAFVVLGVSSLLRHDLLHRQ